MGLWGPCPLGPGMQGPGQVPQEEWKLSTCLSPTYKAIQTFASDKSPQGPRGLEASQGPLVASLVAVLLALNPHKPARAHQPERGAETRASCPQHKSFPKRPQGSDRSCPCPQEPRVSRAGEW